MLARKHHGRALEQTELVFARKLSKRNHRTAKGDRTNCRAQEQLKSVAKRNGRTARSDIQGIRLGHGGNSNKHCRQTNHGVHKGHKLRHFGHLDPLGHGGANGTAHDQACHDQAQALGQRNAPAQHRFSHGGDQAHRGENGNRHAGHAKHISSNRGGGVRQPFECLNKTDRCNQVQKRNGIHGKAKHLRSLLLGSGCLLLFFLEHFQHTAGHQKAAEYIHGGQGHGQHAHGHAQRGFS